MSPRAEQATWGWYSRYKRRRSSNWLQNGCRMWDATPVLKLGIHPEMERPAILNRSIPSTAGVTISILPLVFFQSVGIVAIHKTHSLFGGPLFHFGHFKGVLVPPGTIIVKTDPLPQFIVACHICFIHQRGLHIFSFVRHTYILPTILRSTTCEAAFQLS